MPRGCAGEGLLAGGHFVENRAERKNVGAGVEGFSGGLLGGHVGEGAERPDCPVLRELLSGFGGIVWSRRWREALARPKSRILA